MDIERKLYQELLHWKQKTQGKKVLLIEGARRVGKSTIAEKFGREQYRSYLLIDFNKAPKSIKDNFEYLNELDIFFQICLRSTMSGYGRGLAFGVQRTMLPRGKAAGAKDAREGHAPVPGIYACRRNAAKRCRLCGKQPGLLCQ